MSTGTVTSFLACQRAQASFWHVDGHILACRRPQLCRFWHVDRHERHFGMSTGKFWHVHGRSYVVFLACRRAHVILTCRRGHFGMSTGTFTILHFTIFPFQPTFWHPGPSFWHVDGRILACRRAHLLFTSIYYSLNTCQLGRQIGCQVQANVALASTCNSENRSLAPLSHLCLGRPLTCVIIIITTIIDIMIIIIVIVIVIYHHHRHRHHPHPHCLGGLVLWGGWGGVG